MPISFPLFSIFFLLYPSFLYSCTALLLSFPLFPLHLCMSLSVITFALILPQLLTLSLCPPFLFSLLSCHWSSIFSPYHLPTSFLAPTRSLCLSLSPLFPSSPLFFLHFLSPPHTLFSVSGSVCLRRCWPSLLLARPRKKKNSHTEQRGLSPCQCGALLSCVLMCDGAEITQTKCT